MDSELATGLGLDPRDVAEIRVLVPTGYGLNCEAETSAAFELLGARVEQIHVGDLVELAGHPERLSGFSIVTFIGGFSFGDHVASGRVLANRLRARLGDALANFVADGGLAIGMCNGLQVMTKLGLLPGPLTADDPVDRLCEQRVSVVGNERLGYRNAWVRMRCDPASPCVWTRGLDWLESPSRHGEGKLVFAEGVREQLEAEHRIPVRYVDEQGEATESWPQNPNGSVGGAAGLCDRSGRVFGLMPHPEAFLYRENHPRWLVRPDAPSHGLGLRVFANGLRAAVEA